MGEKDVMPKLIINRKAKRPLTLKECAVGSKCYYSTREVEIMGVIDDHGRTPVLEKYGKQRRWYLPLYSSLYFEVLPDGVS